MQIGLQLPSFKQAHETVGIRPGLKTVATAAEDAGFYSLWVMDHFYQIKGLFGEAYTEPMLEAYTTLGYLAGVTERIHLGALVTGVIYRHPSVLLKAVNTLDIVADGRAYLGIGAAWYEDEAKGYGIPYPSTSERFEWLEDTLKLAHAVWSSTGETNFQGQHVQAPAITNNPPPPSNPHPKIMIGGMGPKKTLRMVAQYADTCNFFEFAGADKLQASLDTLREHCETLGRDYDSIEKTSLGTVTLAEGKDTVESIIERCRNLAEMGFSHAIFNMTNVYDVTPLEIFGQDIIPVVREF